METLVLEKTGSRPRVGGLNPKRGRVFIDRMTSDRKLKASREGSKRMFAAGSARLGTSISTSVVTGQGLHPVQVYFPVQTRPPNGASCPITNRTASARVSESPVTHPGRSSIAAERGGNDLTVIKRLFYSKWLKPRPESNLHYLFQVYSTAAGETPLVKEVLWDATRNTWVPRSKETAAPSDPFV